jgi:hypothetical protein
MNEMLNQTLGSVRNEFSFDKTRRISPLNRGGGRSPISKIGGQLNQTGFINNSFSKDPESFSYFF